MYRPSRVILTGWVLIPIAPKHDAHLCSLPISLFLSLTASKSPSFTRQANATKSSRKSSESITPRFLSLSSIRSILPSTEFFHPSLHSPVKSTFSITFVFIYYYFIELHHHPCTGECRKKIYRTFFNSLPLGFSVVVPIKRKTFDRSIPPNLAFSLNQIIIPVLFSRVLLCHKFLRFSLSLRLFRFFEKFIYLIFH